MAEEGTSRVFYGKEGLVGINKDFSASGVELTSLEASKTKETKEWRDHVGETMTVCEYDFALEVSASGYMLKGADATAFETAFKAYVAELATGAVFALAAGGTTFVTEFKTTESNEDLAQISVSAKYRPNVKQQASAS